MNANTLYPLLQPTVLLDVSYIYFHCALHLLYGPPQKWISSVCPSRSILHLDLCPWSLTCMEWISKILAILCPVGFSQLEDVTRERAESIHSRLSLPACFELVAFLPQGHSSLEDVTRERAESIHSHLSLPPCLFWVGCFPYPKVTVLLRPCLSLSPGFYSSSLPCLWDGNSTPLLLASEYHIVCWFSWPCPDFSKSFLYENLLSYAVSHLLCWYPDW